MQYTRLRIDSHVHMSGFRHDLSSFHKVVAMHNKVVAIR
jgi:hypothetical protein